MSDVDARILWLAGVICIPTWRAAFRAASDRTLRLAGFDAFVELQAAGTIHIGEQSRIVFGFADRANDPMLRAAWQMLALHPDDGMGIHAVVAGVNGLLCSADGDTSGARARLRIWDDVARGKYTGGDFFELAELYWRGEMHHIVAAEEDETRASSGIPACVAMLEHNRWDAALAWLIGETDRQVAGLGIKTPNMRERDRETLAATISEFADLLFAQGRPWTGELALAWQMLTCDPKRPPSFTAVLPQLQYALDHSDVRDEEACNLRERIRIWWRAAEGEWTDSVVSVFRIADVETQRDPDVDDPDLQPTPPPRWTSIGVIMSVDQALAPEIDGPTLVVMPGRKATKLNNFQAAYKDLVDAALPLVVARDVAGIRAAMHLEFPHAVTAIDLLLRDLRDGQPAVFKPVILVGSPGAGKSRVVRRMADLTRVVVYRFDASSSTDGHFGGTSKGWGNTEPSVPMRAVAQSRTANPVVLVDEIEKSAGGGASGSLWSSLLAFLDRETAGRYRDQSLDAEVNLSAVSYVATANDVTRLPAPLRDRCRIIKVPDPGLQHLPQLAAQVMRDLGIEDEARSGDVPLAGDELAVIGKAWAKAGFSMRKLQKIVTATLDARDNYAQRH